MSQPAADGEPAVADAVAAAAESLASEAGLDAVALGERAVERAVRARLAATDLAAPAWVERLRQDRMERAALIDAVVVPETRLFRDGSPFEALVTMAASRASAVDARRPMRVLSAACSTGEEPYSAAIALLAGGLPPTAIEVMAFDVSATALAVAAAGVLPRTAARGPVPVWAEPWLDRQPDGSVIVAPAVRERVTFRVANVLTADEHGPFHAILCRNLLIYLTPPARARVIPWLRAQLAPGAPLFVGHAEVGVLLDGTWRRLPMYGPYALEAMPVGPAAVRPAPVSAPQPTTLADPVEAVAADAVAGYPATADAVAAAASVAETGARDAAVAMLVERLRQVPDDVEAHALLGVLHATAGRRDAARDALRRALYLDPDHAESRAQLALLDAGPSVDPDPGGRS